MYIIGIDPGLTGAIADSLGNVFDMPTEVKGKGTGVIKTHIDGDYVYSILASMIQQATKDTDDGVAIYIEEQVYRKKFKPGGIEIPQGGSSIFSLGDSYGAIRTAAALQRVKCEAVMPATWTKKFPEIKGDKEKNRLRAIELFPQSEEHLKRKKDHNRADALLITYYGMIMEGLV